MSDDREEIERLKRQLEAYRNNVEEAMQKLNARIVDLEGWRDHYKANWAHRKPE